MKLSVCKKYRFVQIKRTTEGMYANKKAEHRHMVTNLADTTALHSERTEAKIEEKGDYCPPYMKR